MESTQDARAGTGAGAGARAGARARAGAGAGAGAHTIAFAAVLVPLLSPERLCCWTLLSPRTICGGPALEPRGARASAVRIALTRGSVQFRFLPLWVVPLFRSHLSTQQMKPKQLEVHPPVCMGVRLTQAGSATIPPRQRSASPLGKPRGPGLATANTGVDGTGSLRLSARAPYACKDQRGQKMGEAMATQDFDFALPRATRWFFLSQPLFRNAKSAFMLHLDLTVCARAAVGRRLARDQGAGSTQTCPPLLLAVRACNRRCVVPGRPHTRPDSRDTATSAVRESRWNHTSGCSCVIAGSRFPCWRLRTPPHFANSQT